MSEWHTYMEKVARDMPSFTKQDRPEKVKEIYRALKRDHPDMPAAMKARIAARQGKPGKQKQGPPYKGPLTKGAASYEEAFRPLMAYLRALYQLYQFMHWQTKGQQFYGDHQLFQRLYEKTGEELDTLAEKAIGIAGSSDVVDAKADADGTSNILKGLEQTPAGALNAEKGFISLISTTRDGLGDKLTDGLDNMLQGLADTHEGHVYLLQQRTGGEKMAHTQASLDRALGSLYTQYGPPLQKHAALTFFNYAVDKDRLDYEALGAPFCKMAAASKTDPWVMARQVVNAYPNLVKVASGRASREQELSRFYVGWADEIVKKANILTSMGNVASKAKAVGGALVGPAGALRSGKQLATQGILKGEAPSAGKAVGRALKQQNTLQQMGGGSIARGKQLHGQNVMERGIKSDLRAQGWTPPARQSAQAAAPARQARPARQPAAAPSQLGNYMRGAAVLGGLGLGTSAVLGAGQPQPAMGESYA